MAVDAWEALDTPWREALELAWEAYGEGTIPVGAVVADAEARVVARGRNRIYGAAVDGQLARTRLAHAEINALLGLGVERTYEDHTLYTALEPCHLCYAAAVTARIGRVLYAARDPWGGAVGLVSPSRDVAAHAVVYEGPLPGPFGLLPEVLHAAHFLWRLPGGNVATLYERELPDVAARAAALLEAWPVEAARNVPLCDALPRLAHLLA